MNAEGHIQTKEKLVVLNKINNMKRVLLLTIFLAMCTVHMMGQTYNVTFEVNTENITVDPAGLFIAGGAGFGVAGDYPLVDPDGDGIYTTTLQRDAGFSSHYTILNGNCPDWSCKEDIAGLPCADPLAFNDRFLPELTEDVTIKACFGNCANDGSCEMSIDSISIIFELNTALIAVDPEGVFLAGGGTFGNPGDNPMVDPDGDGIYTITIEKPSGFSSFYTFTNGACPDYSCKENLAGLPCGDPTAFNDRFLDPVTTDTTIKACFGTCDDDGGCTVVLDSIEITFLLNTENIDVDPNGVFIAGGGQFGNPGDNPMIDPDGDDIYTFVSTRPVGFSSHYTFLNGNCPDWTCKEDISGQPCADENAFNDRFLDNITQNTTILACFGNCADDGSCMDVSVQSLDYVPTLFEVVPTIAVGYVDIEFGATVSALEKNISVINIAGQVLYTATEISNGTHRIHTASYEPGVYLATVQTQTATYTRKFIVQ